MRPLGDRAVGVRAVLLAVLLATTGATPCSGQAERTERWRNDLDHLVTELERRHPDLYHTVPRADFRAQIAEIAERVPSLTDDQVALALARLLARVGDGHTLVPLAWDRSLGYRRLPLEFIRAGDDLGILAADSALAGLAGARVVRIGSLTTARVLDSVSTLVSTDNPWTAGPDAAAYVAIPEILHGLGIVDSLERVSMEVEVPDGSQRRVTVPVVDREAGVRWSYGAFDGSRPWLERRDEPYWLALLPGGVAYVQFNRADRDREDESLAEFGRRLLGLVEEGRVRRIVLDLRWNRGGSRWRARHLLGALIAAEHELGAARATRSRDPGGHLVTLIGPNTFSAATLFALDLELHTNTSFVGEPTGGRPNHFGEVGRFRLPHSDVEIRHSVYYRQATHPRDTRPAIFPDRSVEWSINDVREGRDPTLEAALRWDLPGGSLDALARRIEARRMEDAVAWLDSVRSPGYPDRTVTEADVNRLGYRLLREDRPADALALFRWNLEHHPWSANAHDSMADALLELGREREADRLLCLAFAIDRQFDRALERGATCGEGARESTPGLGRVDFPNSGDPSAQPAFLRGVLLLHSFEYEDARVAFREAREADPGFALAYWGEALTHDHPLWGSEDPEAARAVLSALGPDRPSRLARAGTPRERRLLASAEALFGEGSKAARDAAYADSLAALHHADPSDDDVAALYGLAILGTAEGGRDHGTYVRAAAVLEEVVARSPGHPGALHYLIHAYDDPVHAPLGLRAARRYADVAPASSHALHMPTHIFFALGMWEEAVDLNTRSWRATVDRAERMGAGPEAWSYHPLFWLHYAHLQQDDRREANTLLDRVRSAVLRTDDGSARGHLARMRAHQIVHGDRSLVESALRTRRVGPITTAGSFFAAGLALAGEGRLDEAASTLLSLRALADEEEAPAEVELMARALEAVSLFHAGERARALRILEEAAGESDALPFEFGPPPIVKPLHELLGELYLEMGDARSAESHFQAALRRDPGRLLSIRGFERATAGGRATASPGGSR